MANLALGRMGWLGGMCLVVLAGCPKAQPSSSEPAGAKPDAALAGPSAPAMPASGAAAADAGPSKLTVSSTFSGSAPENAIDGKPETSWYSAGDDTAAHGAAPFVELDLGKPTTVRHVKILGNRDPDYPTGYAILSGKIELFDASRRVLATHTSKAAGASHDFDFRPPQPIAGVKSVRFTSLEDEGKTSPYRSVGIAELQVE